MPTVAVNLDKTQYVKVNSGFNPIMLQCHRDSVRIVISAVKPAKTNEVFHTLSGGDNPLPFNSIDTNIWALALTNKSSLIVSQTSPIPIAYGAGPNLDAIGRLRTSNPFAVFDNKNISNKNRNQWEEEIIGGIIVYNTLTGTFTDTEEIRGLLPAGFFAIGTVVSDNGSDSMTFDCRHNDFTVGDTITGQTSGATAVIVSANTGSDVQHDFNTASVILTVGTSSGDKAVRQAHRYSAYVPGKSHFISDTFVFGAAKANVRRRAGYFDQVNGEGNGLFFEQNGTTDIAFVRRTDTSGSSFDNRYVQANWNLDKLDGTGLSGITLDLTKSHLLVIDFLWQGVGSVRYGFEINNKIIYCHILHNANNLDVPFMRTPTLPIRHEIENLASTASSSSMSEICASVVSEGGYQLPGFEFSQSRGVVNRSVSARTPIFAIRLKTEFPAGKENRRTAKFLNAGAVTATNDAHFEIVHIHEAVDFVHGGPEAGDDWQDVGGGSAMEYSVNITDVTSRPEHVIENIDATTAAGNKAQSSTVSGEFVNAHGFISQNLDSTNSELFVIYATPVTGNADVRGHITLIEFD